MAPFNLIRWIILTVCMVTANAAWAGFTPRLVQFNQAVKLPSGVRADEDVTWFNGTELLVAKNSSGVYVSETFHSRYEFDRSNGRLIIQNFTDDQNGANNYTCLTKTSTRSYRLFIIAKVKITSDTQVPKELDGYGHNVTRDIRLLVIPSHLEGRIAEIALYSVSTEEDSKYITCEGDRSQSDAQNKHRAKCLSKPYVRSRDKKLGNHLTIEQANVSKNDADKKFYLHVFFIIDQPCQNEKLRPIKFHAGADGDEPQKNTRTPVVKFTTIPTTAEGDKHQIKTASPMNPPLVASSAKTPNRTEVTGKPTSHSHKTVVGNPIFILMIIAWLLSWLHY